MVVVGFQDILESRRKSRRLPKKLNYMINKYRKSKMEILPLNDISMPPVFGFGVANTFSAKITSGGYLIKTAVA